MANSKLEIKIAKTSDVHTIVLLASKTFEETYGQYNPKEAVASYINTMFSNIQIQKEIETKGERFFIAYLQNEPVGFIKLRETKKPIGIENKKTLELQRIYVLKSFQRFKIGKELVDLAKSIAHEEGVETLWLQVWQKNNTAVQFYQSAGFVIYDTALFQFGDELQDDFLMKLDLF